MKRKIEEIQGPYELPEGWKWVRLGEVMEFKNGINFSANQKGGEGVLTIDVLNMYGDKVYVNLQNLYRVRIKIKEDYLLKDGDILFVRSSVKREGVGWASLFKGVDEPITFCGFIIRGRLNEVHYCPEFLTYFLRSNIARNELIVGSGYVTITNINQKLLKNLLVPIPFENGTPSLGEQRRIVARIEQLFSKIDEVKTLRKSAFEQANALLPSALHQVFSKAKEKGWKWVRLGEIAFMRKQTIEPKDYPAEEFELYSIPTYHKIGFPEIKKGSEIGSSKLLVKPQDVLFGKLNPHIPKVWTVKDPAERRQIATTEFFPIYPKNSKELLNGYLFWFMKYSKFLDSVVKLVIGTTGSRKRLQKGDFLNLKIPLPPLSEQRQIVAYLDRIHEKIKSVQALQKEVEDEIEKFTSSILYQAFCGRL